jgi:transcriptional regulator with XRE-family HTH domain
MNGIVKKSNYIKRWDFMIKNNIEVDVKIKCIENGTTQAQLAEEIETTKSYVNRIIKKQDGVVNKTFVQMMEALGYDIELTYVKRNETMEEESKCQD